jgi:hypothetical protein
MEPSPADSTQQSSGWSMVSETVSNVVDFEVVKNVSVELLESISSPIRITYQ